MKSYDIETRACHLLLNLGSDVSKYNIRVNNKKIDLIHVFDGDYTEFVFYTHLYGDEYDVVSLSDNEQEKVLSKVVNELEKKESNLRLEEDEEILQIEAEEYAENYPSHMRDEIIKAYLDGYYSTIIEKE